MVRNVAVVVILAASLLVAFNNCGAPFEVKKSSLAKSLSSACMAKIQAMAMKFSANLCDDPDSYECDRRVYKPDLVNSQTQSRQCFSRPRGADTEVCVTLNTMTYNTDAARDSAAASAFAPGGEYNREDILCVNRKVNFQNVSLIQSQGSTVEEALETAMRLCRQRGSNE